MSDRRTPPADWVVPAIIVGVGVGVLFVIGLVFALTADDRVEASGLVYELEVYTTCLSDHGANVPVVEARSDGGFSITVPGSLVDGEVDTNAWREAHDLCSDVAPDLFGGLLGGLSGGLFGGLMDGFPGGISYDI
ncbi:MAG: hypothetical protein DRJ50_06810 [Actinobacteria bacterium]|nr:MAG: hypothetical protein DRJ50_06810 [Actinomycetota bacterium]